MPARGILHRWLGALLGIIVLGSTSAVFGQDARIERVLLEAEHFTADTEGWRPIRVGQGNAFVDAIGAGHYSGAQLLQLKATEGPAVARLSAEIPSTGTYRLWARYDYPWRTASAAFRIEIEQRGTTVFSHTFGEPNATRMWFFQLPDAPWNDLQHGVEGPVAEARDAALEAGSATVSIIGTALSPTDADRNVDLVLLTTDTEDAFRRQGERLYPLLDEIARAVPGRLYARVTNPEGADRPLELEAQYTLNRAPWRAPAQRLGMRGAVRSGDPGAIPPGGTTPWMDLTCPDTTHACHLRLRSSAAVSESPLLELASQPGGEAIRTLQLDDLEPELIISIPPYPERAPLEIRSLAATLQSIVTALESHPVIGAPPRRFPVAVGLGDNVERRLDRPGTVPALYRSLIQLLGANAFNNLNLSALAPEVAALRAMGKEPIRFYTYGDYRWNPTEARVEKARQEIEQAGALDLLSGFTLGDEIKLTDWYPRGDEGDALFRQAMAALGETPASLGGHADTEGAWSRVRLSSSHQTAVSQPRLFVRSRQFQEAYALEQLRDGVARVQRTFGPDVLVGANFSPHPDFRPDTATFVKAFREGGLNRASHSDYWWQASEMGPETTGFILDAFRAGLRGRSGVIQPYVMPHSPGNTDRGFLLGFWSSIIHGASAIDLFRVGPEQINTENYVQSSDLHRFRAVREAIHALGPVEDTLLDGARRPARIGLLLGESTDLWEGISPAKGSGIPANTRLTSQASTTERKGLWQALRHAHIPVDMLIEADVISDAAWKYDVIYLAGPWISAVAAEALVRWVDHGGTLVAVAGAGMLDEFGTPLDTLNEALGLRRRDLDAWETFFRPRVEVPRLVVRDRISTIAPDLFTMDVVAWREPITPTPQSVVLATFSDGSPAIATRDYGRGKTVTIGALPGTAYLRSGAPDPPQLPDRGPAMHQPLTAYDAGIRSFIARWAAPAAGHHPRASDALVEVGLVETPTQVVLPLANFGERGTSVTILVPTPGQVRAVWSVKQGPIPYEIREEVLETHVELDLVDYIVLDRTP